MRARWSQISLMPDFSPVVGVVPGVVHDRRHHTPVRGINAAGRVGENGSVSEQVAKLVDPLLEIQGELLKGG